MEERPMNMSAAAAASADQCASHPMSMDPHRPPFARRQPNRLEKVHPNAQRAVKRKDASTDLPCMGLERVANP